jgi:hypothetical protein
MPPQRVQLDGDWPRICHSSVFSRQAENVVTFSWVFGPRLYIVLNNETLKRADTHTHVRAYAQRERERERERDIYI